MPTPRLSFDKTTPDELQIVTSPQGLPFLQSAPAAPQTPVARTQNTTINAQSGNIGSPIRASDDGLAGPRGGLGDAKATEGGRQTRAKNSA
jgi:hypothetical protein